MLVVAGSAVVLFAPSPAEAPAFPYADKVVHVSVFAALAAAGLWRFGPVRPVLLAAVAYALGSELVQGAALPGRQADPLDVLADLVGIQTVRLVWSRLARASEVGPPAPLPQVPGA